MDLACGLDEVLEMGAGKEIAEVDEFAVPLVLDVDGTPAVLAGGHVAADWVLALLLTRSVLRIAHPSMFMVCSEPTTAKGMMALIWAFIAASSESFSSFS